MGESAVVSYLTGGWNRSEFTTSLLGVCLHGETEIAAVHPLPSGPNLSAGRNLLCDSFLRGNLAPWLFMCDTDMWFPPDTVDRLIAAADPSERPVVGGLCMTLDGARRHPTMYAFGTGTDGALLPLPVREWAENELVRVDGTGAACLLIHRNALTAVAGSSRDGSAPWFRETDMGVPLALLGEDLTFCLRCKAAGIPVYVHTGIRTGHMKTHMLA